MYSTNVPQPVFGATGFVSPSVSSILQGVQEDINAAFGGGLIFTTVGGSVVNPNPQSQLATSITAIINNTYQLLCYYTNQVDPAFAQGRMQDAIGRIYFITRLPALPTLLNIACSGGTGVAIPAGALIQDQSGFQYSCVNGGTIPPSGSITLQFQNTVVGPNPIPTTNAVSIVQTIPGWDSVTCSGGTIGQNTENRTQFEARRAASVSGNAQGPIAPIISAIATVPGVIDYFGQNNGSNSSITVNGVTIPANSIYLSVSGGTQAAVAQAILSKLPPGVNLYGGTGPQGSVTVTAYDNNPLYTAPVPYTIIFNVPGGLQFLIAVNIVSSSAVPSNAATLIQNQIIALFAGSITGLPRPRINSLVLASTIINAVQQLGAWAQVRTLLLGSSNTPGASFTGTVTGNTLTVSSVTGTIANGQTVQDATGLLPEGLTITGGSGTTWTVSQTLGSTVGPEAMTSTVPTLASLQVQAYQEPEIVAANVAVTVS